MAEILPLDSSETGAQAIQLCKGRTGDGMACLQLRRATNSACPGERQPVQDAQAATLQWRFEMRRAEKGMSSRFRLSFPAQFVIFQQLGDYRKRTGKARGNFSG